MAGRYKAYPEYKDSGIEWLGDIPSGWKLSHVKHIAPFQVGWTPPTKADANFEGDNLWANISDLKGKVINDTAKRISDHAAKVASMNISPQGSLLYSFKLSVGAVSFAGKDMFTNEAIASFLDRAELPLSYLFYALPVFVIQNSSTNIYGARILNQELIRDACLLAPIYHEAEQIARFLDYDTAKIDRLIAKQQALIALLKEKRQAVISHAVTKGLNPNAKMKDSGVEWLGEVPEHWEVKPLKYLMSLTSGGTPSKGNLSYWDGAVPWASSKDLKSEELYDTQDHITQKAIDEKAAELVPPGSILTVVRGMILQHTFPVVVARVSMAINQDLKSILPTKKVDGDFLSWLLRGASDIVISSTDEAGHGTKVLRMETWLAIQVPVPPLKEQALIVAEVVKRLGQLDTLKMDANKAIKLMQERRTALISAAVTGKIDVRDWEPAPAAQSSEV